MNFLLYPGVVFLGVFLMLAFVDGIYFHLFRYRLFAQPESRTEHVTHTLRAWLLPPVAWLLYVENSRGALLYLAVALIVVDLGVELWDLLVEYGSRANLGGISSSEYIVHIVATTARVAAFSFAIASRPLAAWTLSGPLVDAEPIPHAIRAFVQLLLPGAVLVAVLHVILMHPRFRRFALVPAVIPSPAAVTP